MGPIFTKSALVMVSPVCPLDWTKGAPTFGQTWFWVFLDEVNMDRVGWGKQVTLPNVVGPVPSVEGLSRTKRLTLLQVRGNPSCQVALSWDSSLFLTSHSAWSMGSSWVSSLVAFGLELPIGPPGPPAFGLPTLELLSLLNYMSCFLVINLSIHTDTHTLTHPSSWFRFSGALWLTQAVQFLPVLCLRILSDVTWFGPLTFHWWFFFSLECQPSDVFSGIIWEGRYMTLHPSPGVFLVPVHCWESFLLSCEPHISITIIQYHRPSLRGMTSVLTGRLKGFPKFSLRQLHISAVVLETREKERFLSRRAVAHLIFLLRWSQSR